MFIVKASLGKPRINEINMSVDAAIVKGNIGIL